MADKNKITKHSFIEKLSAEVTKATGSTAAICIAFGLIVLWAMLGPVFHYSENWQLVINTGTTIITFLMVFLIQKSQNKESMAVQLKLNELIAAHEFASNRLVDVENMTEDELKTIHDYYCNLKEKTKNEESLQVSHSIEEAGNMHEIKVAVEEDIKDKVDKNKT
ncbi:low affinity iron permease family protein [Panacibacter ginsenosidivorans]|uniref:Low affinity iron permease family protein n=1 Tax=Panacibacter ginsenosidivorans TaxID=1813871 RepID=A0A5B8V740_9BACT|nr:low affinity iron permease family protein [Panacibacter ginsenosidivorans]QEC66496.1 low affinity iron permease family protein [Panacibacter ginsenosidivorans]